MQRAALATLSHGLRRRKASSSSASRANSALSRGAARWLTESSSEADAAKVHPQCESSAGAGGHERNSSPSNLSTSEHVSS